MLKENAIEAGVDPAFEIIDDVMERVSFNRLIEDYYERDDKDFVELVELYGQKVLAKALNEIIALWRSLGKSAKEIDYLILIGQSTDVVESMTVNYGLSQKKIINLGWTTPAKVFEQVLSLTVKASTTLAIGNMGGMGAETAEFFENRSSINYD